MAKNCQNDGRAAHPLTNIDQELLLLPQIRSSTMINASIAAFVRHLNDLNRDSGYYASDGDLLERFLQKQDEEAFASLVGRHGRMVLGVCRRMLGNVHDAEDVFQAVFLVLAQRAAIVNPRENVGRWLHGVACRTALDARKRLARRNSKELQFEKIHEPELEPRELFESISPILDEEINRLPARYRDVLILCDLEGKSRKEASVILGTPEGTISSRLSRGRNILARSLSRRGVTIPTVTLVTLLTQRISGSAMRPIVTSTISTICMDGIHLSKSVETLVQGALKTMSLSKFNLISCVLLFLLLGTGGMVLLSASEKTDNKSDPASSQIPKESEKRRNIPSIEGAWVVVEADANGKHQPREIEKYQYWVITNDRILVRYSDHSYHVFKYHLRPDGQRNAIDIWIMHPDQTRFMGIYQLKGDTLTIRYTRNQHPSAKRPKHLRLDEDNQIDRGARYFVLRRDNPEDKAQQQKLRALWKFAPQVTNGLRGRVLLRKRGKENGTNILGLDLELLNTTTKPIRLTNDPRDVQIMILDCETGKIVKESKIPRKVLAPDSSVCTLPKSAYLGFSLDRKVDTPKQRSAILALHNQSWILDSGKYVLTAKYSVTKTRIRPQRVWLGEIQLPPIIIDVPKWFTKSP